MHASAYMTFSCWIKKDLLPFAFFWQGYSVNFLLNLYKKYISLKSSELEELPRFRVMSRQPS